LNPRNIKLVLEYDGTNFFGWQRQAKERTVQGELETLLFHLLHEHSTLIGAGRTDSGVHARGQVANFKTTSLLPSAKIRSALNGLLSPDIAVIAANDVEENFHSRFSAKERRYSYTMCQRPTALFRNYCWEYHAPLDMTLMNDAANGFIGEMDFTSFCTSAKEVENTICTVLAASWEKENSFQNLPLFVFRVSANRFLRGMVRAMVGVLVDVGRKKYSVHDVANILSAKNRSAASQSVPARGLCLEEVVYE